MLHTLRERYHYSLILLKELVKTDFKLRYQGSILGYLWSLLKPLMIFMIMYVVFLKFLRFNFGVPHPTVYLFTGIITWNFFSEATGNALSSIVGKGDLLRKINFPKYVIVLASSLNALINLLLNYVVLAVFMFADHVHIGLGLLWIIPLVGELYILSLAIGFILGTLFVRLRDMAQIWEVVMQGMFYAVPMFYPIQLVPHKYAKILLLNPIAQIMQDMRHVIVSPKAMTIGMLWNSSIIRIIPVAVVLLLAVFSVQFFRKRAKFFAEEI
ncbi:MAG TPA: ABC transporter permease [Candidatus Saccharimonadales bacterium]|nr:ABC transporter permease [Candidatus Saccharimonadales bacterium]